MLEAADRQLLETLLADLSGPNDRESYSAKFNRVRALGLKAVPDLIEILEDKTRYRKLTHITAQLLSDSRDSRAIRPLINLCADPTMRVYFDSFVKPFRKAAIDPLCEAVLDESLPAEGRVEIVQLLEQLEDKRAVEPLIKVLQKGLEKPVVEDNFAGKFAEVRNSFDKISSVLELVNNFFGKHPELTEGLQLYFFLGSFASEPDETNTFTSKAFREAFEQSVELFTNESYLELAKARTHQLLKPYLDRETIKDLIVLLSYERKEEKPDEKEEQINLNKLRAEAAEALGRLEDSRAVDALVQALEDPSPRVRAGAARGIDWGEFRDERARPLLLALLQDENSGVRENAASALKLFKDAPTGQEIIELEKTLYSGTRQEKNNAASTLAGMGEAGIKVLLKAFESEDKETLLCIFYGLIGNHPTQFVEPLIEKLHHPNAEIRSRAADSLGSYGYNYEGTEPVEVDPAIVPALLEVIQNPDEEPQVKKEAISSLGDLQDRRAIPPLIVLLEQVLANSPAKIQPGETLDKAASDQRYNQSQLQDTLVRILTNLKASEAADLFIRLATEPNDLGFQRARAISGLGYIGNPKGFDTVLAAIHSENGEIREHAAIALGEFRDVRAFEPLVEALYNDKYCVPARAIVSLGILKDSRAYEHLLNGFNLKGFKKDDCLIKYSAVRGFGELGDRAAIPLLMEALADSNPEVRFEAAEALGKLDAREAIPLLRKVAENDEEEVCFCCHAGGSVAEAAKTALETLEK
jgi:HEAT repeat protein